ncbi:tetratricopeptide repeat protein [Nonomuraea sp. NPDC050153]|uniref:tetratricopeptide repeat protein n=1 Tax=Nonomuraea sp. NPDC050153 TaxID=3364359 RepID=UPI003798347F
MSQRATASGFARVFQAARDMIVYEGGEPYRLAAWPTRQAVPPAAQARAQPSVLLRASNGLIDFIGRGREVEELEAWREGAAADGKAGAGAAVHLIHGPGGQGKTRLAGHVAELWQRQGWVVLAAHHRRDRSAADALPVPALDQVPGVLVVVDYAERWETADLLSLLADTRVGPGMGDGLPVRVLLLARPAGTWWQSLEGRIQRDVRLAPTKWELGPLEEDANAALTRTALFTAARDRFADLLGMPGARGVEPPQALARHEAYRVVLTVHMAALAAVLAHDSGEDPPADPVRVSHVLLARERDHWEAMSAPTREKPLATTADAMGQVVYAATVTGPLDYRDGKSALERAGIDSHLASGQLLKDHAVCYPPVGPAGGQRAGVDAVTVLQPLYPDRLGEDFIALATPGHPHEFPADPWADDAAARLLAPTDELADPDSRPGGRSGVPVWARHGVTTLIEAARRWPHLAHGQLYPLLAAHPHLALHAGGAALATLAALRGIDPTLLEAIEAVLPADRHIDLDIGMAALAERLAEHRLATTSDPEIRARIHDDLAVRLSYAGLHSRALTAGRQAAQIWRQLAELHRDAYLPGLADSLNNHAVWLVEMGRRDEAMPVSEEAVALYRELAALNRDAHLPGLATSLANHAARLAQVGRRDEAVPVSEEAVGLSREPAALNREAHLPDLAMALNNHAVWLAEVGQWDEAMPVSEEAVALRRELVALNRDAHLPGLATSLANHAARLAEVGRREEAVPVSEESVVLYRELAELNRGAHLPGLADSLNNHAAYLEQVGRRTEAVPVSEESVVLYRELAEANWDAYLPGLARSLTTHAGTLARVGRREEAVEVSEDGVQLYGELAELNRDAYLPDLARSLTSYGRRLGEAGRRDEAVPVSEGAVGLYRELAELNRDAYLPGLAMALNYRAIRLAEVGRRDEATAVGEEAVRLYGELAELNREAYLPYLAAVLTNHVGYLARVGRPDEAVPVSEEAVGLSRELAAFNRAAYLPDLAMALNNHAALLAGFGGRDEVVPVSEEAVGLYRELAELNRDAYLPDLARSLTNYATYLARIWRRDEAVPVSEEAVRLSRELAELNQDAYLPGYTRSLTVFGYALVECARYREAVAPLVQAFLVEEELPEYAQDNLGTIADLLRRAYRGDVVAVTEEVEEITGEYVPAWMKEPPAPFEDDE